MKTKLSPERGFFIERRFFGGLFGAGLDSRFVEELLASSDGDPWYIRQAKECEQRISISSTLGPQSHDEKLTHASSNHGTVMQHYQGSIKRFF